MHSVEVYIKWKRTGTFIHYVSNANENPCISLANVAKKLATFSGNVHAETQ